MDGVIMMYPMAWHGLALIFPLMTAYLRRYSVPDGEILVTIYMISYADNVFLV